MSHRDTRLNKERETFLSTKEVSDAVKLILLREAVLKTCLIGLLTAACIMRKLYFEKNMNKRTPNQISVIFFLGFLRFDQRSSFHVHLLLLLQLEMKMFFL